MRRALEIGTGWSGSLVYNPRQFVDTSGTGPMVRMEIQSRTLLKRVRRAYRLRSGTVSKVESENIAHGKERGNRETRDVT